MWKGIFQCVFYLEMVALGITLLSACVWLWHIYLQMRCTYSFSSVRPVWQSMPSFPKVLLEILQFHLVLLELYSVMKLAVYVTVLTGSPKHKAVCDVCTFQNIDIWTWSQCLATILPHINISPSRWRCTRVNVPKNVWDTVLWRHITCTPMDFWCLWYWFSKLSYHLQLIAVIMYWWYFVSHVSCKNKTLKMYSLSNA